MILKGLMVLVLTTSVFAVTLEGGPRGRLIDLLNADGSGCADSLIVEEYADPREVKLGTNRVWIVKFVDRCGTLAPQ